MDINDFLRRKGIKKNDVIYNMMNSFKPKIDLVGLLRDFENEIKNAKTED